MDKKFLSTLFAFGLMGQFFASAAVGNTQNADNTTYGFIGRAAGQKILVRSSPTSEPDTFYFKPETQQSLYIKIAGEEYQVLNLQLSKDGKNFEFKEYDGIKRPIYSSSDLGVPPSLIIEETTSKTDLTIFSKKYFRKYLLYVSRNGAHKFNDEYKFENPLELESIDFTDLRCISGFTAFFITADLNNKYRIDRAGWPPTSYLLVTPIR